MAYSDNEVVAIAIMLGINVLVGMRREHLWSRVSPHLVLGIGDGFVFVPVYAIQAVASSVTIITHPYEVYLLGVEEGCVKGENRTLQA